MGKFVMRKTETGIVFHLKAGNGEIIATSEVYKSKASCLNGIESIKENAPKAKLEDQTLEHFEKVTNPKFVIYTAKDESFRFHLTAVNGEIIAVSQGYTAKQSCTDGIHSVRENAPAAIVQDDTDKE
ncbi:MAG: YegP family protein [Clostridia bacterium]